MSTWRSIFRFLFGDKGPFDIVVIRGDGGAHFRLPSRWHPVGQTRPWLLIPFLFGPIVLFLTFSLTLSLPEHEQDLAGMWMLAAATLGVMVLRFLKWRTIWYYELYLTAETLQATYYSTITTRRGSVVQLEPIQQFTVVRGPKSSSLQAEAKDGAPIVLIHEEDAELLVRVAIKLAEERQRLDPSLRKTLVAAESSLQGAFVERPDQPLHSKIVLAQQETGVTLDFPLRDDGRTIARRRAWNTFQVAICLLIGAIVCFALASLMQWHSIGPVATLAFIIGLILLVVTANQSVKSWTDNSFDEDLRQLAVAGNLLIRTARDHRKQLWYRAEIDAISLEDDIETKESHGEGGSSVIAVLLHVRLVVRAKNGDKEVLARWDGNYPLEDYRPKAELEWVATVLRCALWPESSASLDAGEIQPPETEVSATPTKPMSQATDTRIMLQ